MALNPFALINVVFEGRNFDSAAVSGKEASGCAALIL
jgi:hypothetical protein